MAINGRKRDPMTAQRFAEHDTAQMIGCVISLLKCPRIILLSVLSLVPAAHNMPRKRHFDLVLGFLEKWLSLLHLCFIG
jgi:hypothetical protein